MTNEASVIAFSKEVLSISTASFLQEKNFPQRTYLHRGMSSDEESGKPGLSISEDSDSEENLDPNIVCTFTRHVETLLLISSLGNMGRTQRSSKPEELESCKEVGSEFNSLLCKWCILKYLPSHPSWLLQVWTTSETACIYLTAYMYNLSYRYFFWHSFGLFVLLPCSEIWGRKRVIHFGELIIVLFNAVCRVVRTKNEIIAFRFIAGLGGSATLGVSLACSLRGIEKLLTISPDWCWHSFWLLECRGARPRNDYYQLAPVLGPAIGPIGKLSRGRPKASAKL